MHGFLLGDTRGVPDDVTDDYRAAGLSHLLAVSGANVAFVLALVAPILRRQSLRARTATALLVVLVFAAMTRFEPSVLRASVLATVGLLATFAGRPASRLRALALAVVALLVVDPFLCILVGFQLSVAASIGIALFTAPIAARLRGPAFVRDPLAVSLAAQVGVTPALLLIFGDVPAVTPLTNLAAGPAAEALGVFGAAREPARRAHPAAGARARAGVGAARRLGHPRRPLRRARSASRSTGGRRSWSWLPRRSLRSHAVPGGRVPDPATR